MIACVARKNSRPYTTCDTSRSRTYAFPETLFLIIIMIDDKFIFSSPTNNGGEGAAGGKRLAKVKTQIHTSHMATKIVKKT